MLVGYNRYMTEQLFGSKTRVKLLEMFVTNPGRAFFVREITRRVEEQINSVRRELANLLDIGIITSENKDNKLYYQVVEKSKYYPGLARLFSQTDESDEIVISESEGNDSVVRSRSVHRKSSDYDSLGKIQLVIQTGKFTRDNSAGVDMLFVGDISKVKLRKFMSELEVEESMEINYASMPLEEFEYRQQVNDRFLNNVLLSRHIVRHDPNGLILKD